MHNKTHSVFASARLSWSLPVGQSSTSRPEALLCSGSWGCITALGLKVGAAGVFTLQLRGVRISVATNNIALWGFLVPNQSCRGSAVSSTSAWSVSDTLPFEHSAAGQTAPDGVAGEGACTDLGGGWQAGMLAWDWKVTAPAPAIYWALFGLCAVKPCHSFPQLRPRLNRRGRDQSPWRPAAAEERATGSSSHAPGGCVFSFTPSKDVKRNVSFQCPELRCHYQLWAEHSTVYTDAIDTHANYPVHFNGIMSLGPHSDCRPSVTYNWHCLVFSQWPWAVMAEWLRRWTWNPMGVSLRRFKPCSQRCVSEVICKPPIGWWFCGSASWYLRVAGLHV